MKLFNTVPILLFSLSLLLVSQSASAEDTPQSPKAPPSEGEPVGVDLDTLEKALEAERQENAQQKKQIEEQKAEIGRLKEETAGFAGRLSALEMGGGDDEWGDDQEMESFEEDPGQQYLRLSGFFDVAFYKKFVEEGSFLEGYISDKATFLMQHINLYIASQISQSVKALIELRFSFFPQGYMVNPESELTDTEFERVNTTIMDWNNGETISFGGMRIERAILTYEPFDFLAITAGRYLTPFGIWNEDHGTPILLTVRHPVIQLDHAVPLAQTGLMVHGRFFPSENTMLDYAFTLSNGRGPIEEVYDLDNNKGLGFRLRLGYDGSKFDMELGAYGYIGKYTDSKVTSAIMDFEEVVTESYDEYTGTASLLLKFYGVRLQSEFVRSLIKYDERPFKAPGDKPYVVGYPVDYTVTYVYGLLGYTLPLEKWLDEATITPFFMYEHNIEHDLLPKYLETDIYTGGINVKPIPAIVLKAEFFWSFFTNLYIQDNPDKKDGFGGLSLQVVVSF